MRRTAFIATLISTSMLTGCLKKGPNPDDPYESINRKTHAFNMVLDKALLKPAATIYQTILPAFVRTGIDNAYNNVATLPTVANDLLQAEFKLAIRDSWRFVINSSLGMGGVYDAASHVGIPAHVTDLGVTFAKWGDKHSPYIVLPLLGPSTYRDAMGMTFDYALFTPYPFIPNDKVIYGLLGLRYIDLRAQMLENEKLMEDALDKYSFIRDAYLQHRQFLITGEQADTGEGYVDESDLDAKEDALLNKSTDNGEKSLTPITTAAHDTHRTLPTRNTA